MRWILPEPIDPCQWFARSGSSRTLARRAYNIDNDAFGITVSAYQRAHTQSWTPSNARPTECTSSHAGAGARIMTDAHRDDEFPTPVRFDENEVPGGWADRRTIKCVGHGVNWNCRPRGRPANALTGTLHAQAGTNVCIRGGSRSAGEADDQNGCRLLRSAGTERGGFSALRFADT